MELLHLNAFNIAKKTPVSPTRKNPTDTEMKRQTEYFFSKTPRQIPVAAQLPRRPEDQGFLKQKVLFL